MTTATTPEVDPKRLEKAHAIFAAGEVTRIDESTWHVASQTGSGYHLVSSSGPEGLVDISCSCPDWMRSNRIEIGLSVPCKHCLAVALSEGWLNDDPPPPPALQILDGEAEDDGFEETLQAVTSRLQADSLLWQLGQLQAEIEEIDALAAGEIDHIRLWREREGGKLTRRVTALSAPLKAYLKREEMKTLRLPHGELKLRKLPDKIIVDEKAFDYNRDEFVRVVPEQRKADIQAIRKHLKATGELLPGVDLQLGEQRFSVIPESLGEEVVPAKKEAA